MGNWQLFLTILALAPWPCPANAQTDAERHVCYETTSSTYNIDLIDEVWQVTSTMAVGGPEDTGLRTLDGEPYVQIKITRKDGTSVLDYYHVYSEGTTGGKDCSSMVETADRKMALAFEFVTQVSSRDWWQMRGSSYQRDMERCLRDKDHCLIGLTQDFRNLGVGGFRDLLKEDPIVFFVSDNWVCSSEFIYGPQSKRAWNVGTFCE